jgi:hypothetical protein
VTTAATVIDRTLRQLLSGTVEPRNKLSSTINSSATSVVTTYALEGLRQGQTFEIDSELFYIWEADNGAKTLTVERGYSGTTAASHTGGALIKTAPRFPRAQLLEAINDELADLSSPVNGLFSVKTVDIDYNGSDTMIDFTGVTNVIDLLSVSVRYLTDDYPVARKVRLVRDVPTDDFPSGLALRFDQGVFPGRLRIVYKAPYAAASSESTNLVTTSGVQDSVIDLLVLGCQIRMMAPREIKRNFTESQGDTRRAEEVGAGAVAGSITNLMRMRRDRIIAESARLKRSYPTFLTKD